MLTKSFIIKMVSTSEKNLISFPRKLIKKQGLKLKLNDTLMLSCGCNDVILNVAKENRTKYVIISQNIMQLVGIRDGQQVNAICQSSHHLRLGPYIGVFSSVGSVNSIKNGNPYPRLLELAKASDRESVILYFYSIRDVCWLENKITGYSYIQESKSWEKIDYPFPDILYDRGGGFLTKQLLKAEYMRKQMKHIEKIKKLNAKHTFNKWDTFNKLSSHDNFMNYLPDTVLYEGTSSLKNMLKKHKSLYLKSTNGSNGRQVLRLTKKFDKYYEINYYKKGTVIKLLLSLEEVIKRVHDFFDGKAFIIQQSIDVIQYQGNNVDLRALLQRNQRGEWQITAVPVRISNNYCAVTSTSTGSSCYKFEYAFSRLLNFTYMQIKNIKRRVTAALYTAVNSIEKEYGRFGEIGIDLALDSKGKLWFIECNAKPGKDTIFLSENYSALEKCFLLPIQYSKFLTGFTGEYNDR